MCSHTRFDVRVLLLAILTVSFVSVAAAGGLNTTMRSVFNEFTPDLAVDGDRKTCAVSGWETGGWWKAEMATARSVAGFTVVGDLDSHQVRVGNFSDELGLCGGFDKNPLCSLELGFSYMTPQTVTCRQILTGSVVSIQMVDPISIYQMKLCDVKVIFA